jgi:hypothetical protein
MTSIDKEIARLGDKIDALADVIDGLRKTIELLTDAIDELGEAEAGGRPRRRVRVEKLLSE